MHKEFMLPDKTSPVNQSIPFSDRIIHMERMVLSFITEYSLPFSSARNIVELAKEMMHDPKIANKLQVAKQTKSYKMQHRLAKGLEKHLIDKFREEVFSFNINDATSLNLHKVLTLLVSYFCTAKKEVFAEHLGWLSLPTVKSEFVFKAVVDLINEKELPRCNLMAVLMGSCSVMRGSKNGFEMVLLTSSNLYEWWFMSPYSQCL